MSEYMERHTVSRLIGAPPGYVGFDQGGLLTDAVDQHPHCVVLLDEIEKAHPDLFNILLQVMDHGKLTDHNGKTVDFRNVILIMTTNAGAMPSMAPSRRSGSARASARARTRKRSRSMFTPEFRNRLGRHHLVRLAAAGRDHARRRQVRAAARRPARRPRGPYRADRRGQDWLIERAMTSCSAPGRWAPDPGERQEAARRRGAVRQASPRPASPARHRPKARRAPEP
jgi:hypothetical protein